MVVAETTQVSATRIWQKRRAKRRTFRKKILQEAPLEGRTSALQSTGPSIFGNKIFRKEKHNFFNSGCDLLLGGVERPWWCHRRAKSSPQLPMQTEAPDVWPRTIPSHQSVAYNPSCLLPCLKSHLKMLFDPQCYSTKRNKKSRVLSPMVCCPCEWAARSSEMSWAES